MRKHAEQRRSGFQPVLHALVALLLLSGCSKESAPTTSPSAPVLSRQYRQGATLVVVTLSETNISSSGSIQLMLDIHAPPQSTILFPELESPIKPFTISSDHTEPPQTLPNGKQRHRRVWTLLPSLPGKTIFQALDIHAGGANITTEPIPISTTSLLPADLDVFEIKDIAPPAPLLPEQAKRQRRWKILFAAGLLLLLPILILRHMREPAPIPVLPPHETALQALEKLPEDPLKKIQALTDLLVTYIGRRFQLPTTGKTIPEIISLLPEKTLLGRRYKLESYLLTSEQIRFSNQIPNGFSDEFKQYIYTFIMETTPEAPCD